MQQDYSAFLQRQVAISVGATSFLLATITFVRLIAYHDNSLIQALLNPSVSVVAVIGGLFLVTTVKSSKVGRVIQVLVSYVTACTTAIIESGGDLTSTVFLIAAMMLATEYGMLTNRPRALVGVPLVIYVACFFSGSYFSTGAILASVHVLLGAGMVAYVFIAVIRTRLDQVRNREDELESKVSQRTEGLQREVKRRAELEESLRETAATSQRLAAERALLLHELHHRTKNDLQLIASMIRLHGEDDESSSRQDLLDAAEDRIMAIALVHEYLYASEELSAIGLADYLDGLVAHMRSAHSGTAISIEEDINTNLAVGIEPAIHLGLAVNELVQNARKHAFPNGRKGVVTISAKEVGVNLELIVSDDGVGIGDAISAKQSGSIGIEIVKGLVEQLEGEISIESGRRTTWTMVLPFTSLRAQPNLRRPVEDRNRKTDLSSKVDVRATTIQLTRDGNRS